MQNPINRLLFVLVTIFLLGMVFMISPAQIPVIIFKASLVSLAAILGYWIDYLLFPHMRPGIIDKTEKDPIIRASIAIRRAIIIFGTILGISMAL
ncbi:MAG: putative holin [Gammaproteobacteria bacterium]|nr:hypothetical protein [Gammaproteobacteria bacterium]MDP6146790.1 putative holin [Gammaproteobacteria bacterium]HJL80015.1 putative holin [Gammaproteobacteria bacterium]HJM09497.1 putative holin [Gammaproteobacteria bacterium]HJN01345.1 putative holin [Gammaproteobacteria bacterium]